MYYNVKLSKSACDKKRKVYDLALVRDSVSCSWVRELVTVHASDSRPRGILYMGHRKLLNLTNCYRRSGGGGGGRGC